MSSSHSQSGNSWGTSLDTSACWFNVTVEHIMSSGAVLTHGRQLSDVRITTCVEYNVYRVQWWSSYKTRYGQATPSESDVAVLVLIISSLPATPSETKREVVFNWVLYLKWKVKKPSLSDWLGVAWFYRICAQFRDQSLTLFTNLK